MFVFFFNDPIRYFFLVLAFTLADDTDIKSQCFI